MNIEIQIPTTLLSFVQSNFSKIVDIKEITSAPSSNLFKLQVADKYLIVKKVIKEREQFFYTNLNSVFSQYNLYTSQIHHIHKNENEFWVLLEYIPFKLPENRWEADRELIHYLAKVHQLDDSISIPSPYLPSWTKKMNEVALSCFDPSIHDEISSKLSYIMNSSQHLFQEKSIINGNPGPLFWAIRKDKTLALFNWEQVGYGHPALDIAISICSSENRETSDKAARYYLEENKICNLSYNQLSDDILRGCTWNYIQFLNKYMDNKTTTPEKLIDHIAEHFPYWLTIIHNELKD